MSTVGRRGGEPSLTKATNGVWGGGGKVKIIVSTGSYEQGISKGIGD